MARAVGWGGLAAILVAGGGCLLPTSPVRTFVSNRDALESLASRVGYRGDPELHRLSRIELLEDSITFQYRGIEHAGDSAWVVRFSEKSSEQDPASLAEISAIVPVLAEGREGFEVVDHGERDLDGSKVLYVTYRFRSAVRDDRSRPLEGRGVLATLSTTVGGDVLVYHLKLDNQGDRDGLRLADLAPFLEPILGEAALAGL